MESRRNSRIRTSVRKRAAGHCEICGDKFKTRKGQLQASMHHRLMRRHGGVDSVANLLFICMDCHRGIHRKPQTERDAAFNGWVVWTIPEITPVRIHRERWVILLHTGTYEDVPDEVAVDMLPWLATFAPSRDVSESVA